jgi:hypothetical protein
VKVYSWASVQSIRLDPCVDIQEMMLDRKLALVSWMDMWKTRVLNSRKLSIPSGIGM